MPLRPGQVRQPVEAGKPLLRGQVIMAVDEADGLPKRCKARFQNGIVALVRKQPQVRQGLETIHRPAIARE